MAIVAGLALMGSSSSAQEHVDEDRPLLDRPAQAAEYRALLLGGRQKANVPADALPKAAKKVSELRGRVAQRFNVAPAAMMLDAAQGSSSTVGGIPVGPLPAAEIPIGGQTEMLPMAAPLGAAAAINPAGWKWAGPGNIGGRIRSILIHPTQPQVMWVGGVGGGVWKTTNGGLTWAPLYDFMASVAVSCMAMHPGDPNTVFAGTGEGFFNVDSVRGFGIFVTKNGGATWNQLPATANENFRFVNRIAVAPSGTNAVTILAATRSGLFRSVNSGATFTAVGQAGTEMLDVRLHPTNSGRCVAGGRSGRAFYSTNGGASWTAATGIASVATSYGGRVELAFARANGDVVYASVDDETGKVYRSTDGGKSYALRSSPGHLSGQGWYANCLWAGDPTNPNLLIAGGLDLHRSTNGGTTFTQISVWQSSPNSAHADHHVIVSHPKYNGTTVKTVLFGNDGGLYRAANVSTVQGTNGWEELNNGLGVTQFYATAVHPPTGTIAGGAQDNGTLLLPSSGQSESWKTIFGGDGGDAAADPVEQYYYGEYIRLQIHRSKDGNPAQYIFTGITDAGSKALFIAPFILDPNNPMRMVAGGASLWRSNNIKVATPTWSAIKSPGSAFISAIAIAPASSSTIWVGNADGVVEKTSNGTSATPTWSVVSGLPNRYCSRITFDPNDSSRKTVYVTSTGFFGDNLRKTTDGGATWNTLGQGTLPEVPFFDVVVHPASGNLLYLGTEVGLFVSDDGGASWSPTNQGPTNAPVYRLTWVGTRLYATTHGRGVFHIDLASPATNAGPPIAGAAADIAP